jgi:hypothetical protein
MSGTITAPRNVVFISKATPGDDEFVLWLAPRLEAAGYTVYADIVRLDPGIRWRQELTTTLQNRAIKMLLCCRDTSLARNGVQEEIGIAEDLVKELEDPQFIIPLRLEPYKKVFGIGELQYVDFSKSWADGLNHLLDALQKQNVPRDTSSIRISAHWEQYRQRNAVQIKNEPEALTSNWLRVVEAAMEALILVATHGGPTMFARIRIMRALNRHVERVVDPSRKDKHWGRRKLARDR